MIFIILNVNQTELTSLFHLQCTFILIMDARYLIQCKKKTSEVCVHVHINLKEVPINLHCLSKKGPKKKTIGIPVGTVANPETDIPKCEHGA